MKKVAFLFCISLFSLACNKLVFEESMPTNGKKLTSFPEEILGTYIELNFNEQQITAELYRIEQETSNQLIVYRKEVEYVDSTYLAHRHLPNIDM